VTARAVQRKHVLRAQPLAKRVAGDESLELTGELSLATER
jgi:hypothetical protein